MGLTIQHPTPVPVPDSILSQSRTSFADGGPTLKQHRIQFPGGINFPCRAKVNSSNGLLYESEVSDFLHFHRRFVQPSKHEAFTNVGITLGQRWPSVISTLRQGFVFGGSGTILSKYGRNRGVHTAPFSLLSYHYSCWSVFYCRQPVSSACWSTHLGGGR